MVQTERTLPPDQSERDRVLIELRQNLLVEAAAGSGKTTSLTGRMIALLAAGECRMGEIAALTFTKKAAAELRARFQARLREAAEAEVSTGRRSRLDQALAESDQGFIGTLHAFAARLLRERPVEAGVALPFREIEAAEDLELRAEAWEAFTARCHAEDSPLLAKLRQRGLRLNDLGTAFSLFAEYPDVEEWPGAAPLPPEVSALRQALRELLRHMEKMWTRFTAPPGDKDRLARLYQRLPRKASIRDLASLPELMSLLEQCRPLGDKDVAKTMWPAPDKKASARLAAAELRRWNDFCETHVQPALAAWRAWRYGAVLEVLQAAQADYELLRRNRGVLNFQDLLMKAARLLREHPTVRRYFSRRYTHLLVDEFQDTDPVQAEILFLLAAAGTKEQNWRQVRPRPGSLFLVGDPQQSIYRFRRADIVVYELVKQRLLATGGEVVPLRANFRSSRPLVEWVNATFATVFPAKARPEAPAHQPLAVGNQDPAAKPTFLRLDPGVPGKGTRTVTAKARAEAARVAAFIAAELRQDPSRRPEDYLILARQTLRLDLFATALEAVGVPVAVTGSSGLKRREALNDLLQWLEALADPTDSVALVALARSRQFGFSDAQFFRYHSAGGIFSWLAEPPKRLVATERRNWVQLFEKLRSLQQHVHRQPLIAALDTLLADTGLWVQEALTHGSGGLIESWATVREHLRGLAEQGGTLHALAQALRTLLAAKPREVDTLPLADENSAVRVMNLHQAKGLEADTVFLVDPGLDKDYPPRIHVDRQGETTRGFLSLNAPSRFDHDPGVVLAHPVGWEELAVKEADFLRAEQDRLRYVAATRARRRLIVHDEPEGSGFWAPLAEALKRAPWLPDAEVPPRPAAAPAKLNVSVRQWSADLERRRVATAQMSYSQAGVKALTVEGLPSLAATWEQGTEWGSLIHDLLQMLLGQEIYELGPLVTLVLTERGLPHSWFSPVTELLEGIQGSSLWRRVLASPQRMVETPILAWQSEVEDAARKAGRYVQGQIDLLFEEVGGWTLVDFKTDRQPPNMKAELVARYRPQVDAYAELWESATGLKVARRSLYFTHWLEETAWQPDDCC